MVKYSSNIVKDSINCFGLNCINKWTDAIATDREEVSRAESQQYYATAPYRLCQAS